MLGVMKPGVNRKGWEINIVTATVRGVAILA
jgi:hypothetical protein